MKSQICYLKGHCNRKFFFFWLHSISMHTSKTLHVSLIFDSVCDLANTGWRIGQCGLVIFPIPAKVNFRQFARFQAELENSTNMEGPWIMPNYGIKQIKNLYFAIPVSLSIRSYNRRDIYTTHLWFGLPQGESLAPQTPQAFCIRQQGQHCLWRDNLRNITVLEFSKLFKR